MFQSRQKFLDNLVKKLHGKGQSTTPVTRHSTAAACMYIQKGHPGCAIGCQPGFRKATRYVANAIENRTILALLGVTGGAAEESVVKWIGKMEGNPGTGESFRSDYRFLADLQSLHDTTTNWRRKNLTRKAIIEFAKKWKLTPTPNPRKKP